MYLLRQLNYSTQWLSCGNPSNMNEARMIEVRTKFAPSFYIIINWEKFTGKDHTLESQWETIIALLKSGSRNLMGHKLAIVLNSSEEAPGNSVSSRFFQHKFAECSFSGRTYLMHSVTSSEKKEIIDLLSQSITIQLLSENGAPTPSVPASFTYPLVS